MLLPLLLPLLWLLLVLPPLPLLRFLVLLLVLAAAAATALADAAAAGCLSPTGGSAHSTLKSLHPVPLPPLSVLLPLPLLYCRC